MLSQDNTAKETMQLQHQPAYASIDPISTSRNLTHNSLYTPKLFVFPSLCQTKMLTPKYKNLWSWHTTTPRTRIRESRPFTRSRSTLPRFIVRLYRVRRSTHPGRSLSSAVHPYGHISHPRLKIGDTWTKKYLISPSSRRRCHHRRCCWWRRHCRCLRRRCPCHWCCSQAAGHPCWRRQVFEGLLRWHTAEHALQTGNINREQFLSLIDLCLDVQFVHQWWNSLVRSNPNSTIKVELYGNSK